MAITTQDGLVAAQATGQSVLINRMGTRTTVAGMWFGTLDLAGNPGAGTLAGSSTAAGVVPTDATAGCPTINAFSGSNKGYMSAIDFGMSLAGRLRLCDLLFKAGAYAFNANTTLASQPSYSGRVPGSDYKGTEIWLEQVTAGTGNQNVAVTYTNQDGTAGRTTGTVSTAVNIVGRMHQLPLQAGDTGVQQINSVVGSTASVGTFNILVLRPLWHARILNSGGGGTHGPDLTDLPEIFADSALIMQSMMDSTAQGVFETNFGVVNG